MVEKCLINILTGMEIGNENNVEKKWIENRHN